MEDKTAREIIFLAGGGKEKGGEGVEIAKREIWTRTGEKRALGLPYAETCKGRKKEREGGRRCGDAGRKCKGEEGKERSVRFLCVRGLNERSHGESADWKNTAAGVSLSRGEKGRKKKKKKKQAAERCSKKERKERFEVGGRLLANEDGRKGSQFRPLGERLKAW